MILPAYKVVKSTALVTQSMTLRNAAMKIWKKKKALTNSTLLLKSLGYQLVMNLQQCAIAFCIAKTLNICYLSILSGLSMLCRGSNLLYNLTIEMLTATFCRAALSHMFVIRPNIADLWFSQVFAKGRTSSTLQVWTFVVFVLTVLKYEQNTWFQIIMAWYDISSSFDQNCGLWLNESWKFSPTFGWND